MASNGGGRGILQVGCLTIIILLIPIVGHIVTTIMILADDISAAEKLLWLVVTWVFWPIGPFLYLLLGHHTSHIVGSHAD